MIDASASNSGDMGRWIIRARSLDGTKSNTGLIMHRDVPTIIESISWTDPFGPSAATLKFSKVNALERFPSSDTWWAAIGTEFDIMFVIENKETNDAIGNRRRHMTVTKFGPAIVWEGYVESRSWEQNGQSSTLSLELLGAMHVLDSRMAQKVIFSRPVPYERVIQGHFAWADGLHPTGLSPLTIQWPTWWRLRYRPDSTLPEYLQPNQVTAGDRWTGLTTREFGRWDSVLSSAIQGLLSIMFTERGQFTLDLAPGRKPVMYHRDRITEDTMETLHIDAAWPGVQFSLVEDGSMSVNAIYGEVRSTMSGISYTGMRHSVSGAAMAFEPFAHSTAVDNLNRDETAMRREIYTNFNDGLTPAEAMEKARQHVIRNAHPGMTGRITVEGVSPLVRHPDGELVPFPVEAIRAGNNIRVHGLGGSNEGQLFHIASVDLEPQASKATMTVDTKYRDFMTVREVMERGKDALRPWHMMTVGKYNVNIKDAMLPWNYEEGSGFIPLTSHQLKFWKGAPDTLAFPWTEWTKRRPPKSRIWRKAYIRVPKMKYNEDGTEGDTINNWNRPEGLDDSKGCQVLLSQAGDIAMLQIAAYDANGNIKPIPFHVSVWASNSASARSTPMLQTSQYANFIDYENGSHVVKRTHYTASTGDKSAYYPFFKNAWEQYYSDGRQGTYISEVANKDDGLLVGYGNYWERAGYWPGTGRYDPQEMLPVGALPAKSKPTGMLQDESGFSYDLTPYKQISLNDPSLNDLLQHGNATVLVYCESDTDTYFLGRLFRREYGG